MAKIFPERPPAIIRDDPLRSSELNVFTALKSLPKSYLVFYNTHWQGAWQRDLAALEEKPL